MPKAPRNPFESSEKILDSLPRAVLVTDTDWRVQYVNQTLVSSLECPAESLLGEHLLLLGGSIGRRDSLGELLRYLIQLVSSPPQQLEVKQVPIQIPERRFIRIHATPYCPEGQVVGYLLTFADVTREGEIDEMKSDFISVASHEMRTPMTSIKGSLELLLGGYAGELPAEATELLGISLTAVDRLIRLINDLLDIAKIESGKMELHLDRLKVTDCVKKSMRSVRALSETHKVSIATEQQEHLPDVFADRDRLEQVITNLLSNALKYSPPESVVRVHVQSMDDVVRVSVADQGPGIPPDKLEKVFDRFQQLSGAKKGTGLGLTISRALIEQHRGRIWVESEVGRGANFHFELPVAPPE
jgi:signal transduction histidine kinase